MNHLSNFPETFINLILSNLIGQFSQNMLGLYDI